jgi:hypothetical protein
MNAPVIRTPIEDRAMWAKHRKIVALVRNQGGHYFCAEAIGFFARRFRAPRRCWRAVRAVPADLGTHAGESDMKERPIPFKGEQVRAILSGTQTQERRMVRNPWPDHYEDPWKRDGRWFVCDNTPPDTLRNYEIKCPHGVVGDRLWVRESAWIPPMRGAFGDVLYQADGGPPQTKFRPSICMPRWASRIDLEITDVRVQRLQDITEADARAEGIVELAGQAESMRELFAMMWDHINGARSPWDRNDWVWAITFKRVRP